MYSIVFDGDTSKKGYTCEFLDLHSIKIFIFILISVITTQ